MGDCTRSLAERRRAAGVRAQGARTGGGGKVAGAGDENWVLRGGRGALGGSACSGGNTYRVAGDG